MIRVGLVGFGMAGRVFHGPLISSVEGLELAAVVERSSNQAAARYPGIVTYRSLEEMLADSSLDLFVVATPSGTHFQVARQILNAGKNTVVDKPMCVASTEIAELMTLAKARNALLSPFHNRRWDSEIQTVRKVLDEEFLGRLVYFESNFDRWRPALSTRLWKEDPAAGGGVLLDLGTHLADQVFLLFGKPLAVSADVLHERDVPGSDDSFTVRLRYPNLRVTLDGNCLSYPAGPRFRLRGTKGNFIKWGMDSQEAALNLVTRITDPAWGQEPVSEWGTLHVDVDGGMVSRPVESIPGDYRRFYVGVRDALLGKAPAPTTAVDAWRVARLFEWALESSEQRREILCDWSDEPQ